MAKQKVKKKIADKKTSSKTRHSKAKSGTVQLKKGPHIAFLGLGSNVGDREEYVEQSIFLLGKNPHIQVMKHSSNYETAPEGNPEQPAFINAVVQIKTTLPPDKLLTALHEIETALGRDREVEWGPRTIDIDILLYDDLIISEDQLQIPHPLMHERIFALKPLKEIAPNLVHPVLEKTIQDIYDEKKADADEKYDDELPGFKEIKQGTYDDYERW